MNEAVSEVVEVVKNTTSTMFEKATKEDIAEMHCYTIRSLNTKHFTGDDMEQYKLMNVEEHPMEWCWRNREILPHSCSEVSHR